MTAEKRETFEQQQERHRQEQLSLIKTVAHEASVEVLKLWSDYVTNAPTSRVMPEGWGNEERSEARDARTTAAFEMFERFLSDHGCNTNHMRGLVIHVYYHGLEARDYSSLGLSSLDSLHSLGWDHSSLMEATIRRLVKQLRAYILVKKWTFPKVKSV